MSDYLDPNNEELLKDFFSEAQMQVEVMERNILALEDDPGDQSAVDEIFRAAHTLKGGSATVQMTELSGFTHKLEDLLDEIRGGRVKITGDNVDVLLSSIDVIKAMIASRTQGDVYQDDYSGVSAQLESIGAKGPDNPPESPPSQAPPELAVRPAAPDAPPNTREADISEYEKLELLEVAGEGEKVFRLRVQFDESNPMNTVGGIQVFARIKEAGQILKTVPEFDLLYADIYHETVDYYVSTSEEREVLGRRVHIPEVTSGITVSGLDEIESDSEPAPVSDVPASPSPPKPAPQGQSAPEDPSIEEKPAPAAPAPEAGAAPRSAPRREMAGGSILRVDSRRIDNLLNLVSESVINKATFNQISTKFNDISSELNTAQSSYREGLKKLFDAIPEWLKALQGGTSVKGIKSEISSDYGFLFSVFDTLESGLKSTVAAFRNTAANLGRNTSDLHEGILRIRMVPISQIFSRFPRLVRDLSRSLDKNIELLIEGEETELDKSVTEELLDPLMHCVRNSVDHGIESPETRRKAGKPAAGRLLLKASNEGNMIVIEISDDGGGIDVQKVRQKAIDRGVIHPNKVLSDVEAFNLIFDPGFSTAGEVTNISGRGVGLDVVKKQIEKLNGSVAVWSKPGEGTRFTIKLPLTLAIIQGLLIRVGTEIYAIPITSVLESHRIRPDEIKVIDNYEVFNVREDVISLLRLNQLFRIPSKNNSEYNFIVIVGSGDNKMGLMVDSLIGEEDVVIKPLKDRFTNSPGIAGATILGDGTVSLIIDVSQLLDLGVRQEQEARRNKAIAIGRGS